MHGGIYLDFDTEFVQSALPYLKRGMPCVLSEEEPVLVEAEWGSDFGISNSIILCRARHPFFRVSYLLIFSFTKKHLRNILLR